MGLDILGLGLVGVRLRVSIGGRVRISLGVQLGLEVGVELGFSLGPAPDLILYSYVLLFAMCFTAVDGEKR